MGVSNDTFAWLVRNRIVTHESMFDDLMAYFLDTGIITSHVHWPEGGFFIAVAIAADGNDKFKLTDSGNISGTVAGALLKLSERASDVEGVQFENSNLVDYQIGLQEGWIPEDIVVNPKDGLPNWSKVRHTVGRFGVPDAVVDNGNGTITFTVDGLTEAGVSNAGRVVKVCQGVGLQFMPAKGAITDAIALETLTIAWDGSNNKITTTGALGQSVISTTPGDYIVTLVGPHVLRNTDISTDPDYAYVGTVQGAGAGNPPSVFDVSGQRMLVQSTANLWHVLREENVPPKRWKIDVKALAGESGVNQIQVQDSGSNIKFSVDEAGNVVIEGDLDVKGTTTTRDVDQVNAYDAYFDNLDAGNADTDAHNVRGEWTHISAGGGITAFAVDGDTGRVGIGGTYDSTHALKVTGEAFFVDHLEVSDSQFRLSTPGAGADEKNWAAEIVSGANQVFSLVAKTDGWAAGGIRFLEVTRAANSTSIDEIKLSATEIAVAGDFSFTGKVKNSVVPDGSTYELGSLTNKWKSLYLSDSPGEGSAGDLVPTVAGGYNLGSPGYPWQTLYLSTAAGEGVGTDLIPATTAALNLGNAGYPWAALYLSDAASQGVRTHLVPALALDLGNASYPWRDGFFSATVNTATLVASGLVSGLGFLASGDPGGGAANTITFTNVAAVPGGAQVRTVQGQNTASNEGYVKFYVAGVAKYIPYWTLD